MVKLRMSSASCREQALTIKGIYITYEMQTSAVGASSAGVYTVDSLLIRSSRDSRKHAKLYELYSSCTHAHGHQQAELVFSMPLQAETGAICSGPFKGTPSVHISEQRGLSVLLLGETCKHNCSL